ncbi:dethiobiotin synthase [Pleionea sp. CnH1-48]|uniref:dethiobiotin synthase n=1 Tax=Pleionea sp. CnH1-48 TaxID=2954494 RepID=UPI0020970B1F|nr:dethiobiotin synthase [Pleionea sp. CnH1-48]
MKRYFVTGTDTEVGKTYVTCLLSRSLAACQQSVANFKPVAAGAEFINQQLCNEDALLLQVSASKALAYEQVNPFCFEPAIAPHIAAANAGVEVTVESIEQSLSLDSFDEDIALVEGAGGWLVPLNDNQSFADIPAALDCDIILVVGMRLGCINHALLTVESIRARGMKLAGWVANEIDPDMSAYADNLVTLTQLISAPLIAEVRYSRDKESPLVSSDQLAPLL